VWGVVNELNAVPAAIVEEEGYEKIVEAKLKK